MNIEQKQLRNLRNRTLEFLKTTTPETLIRLALFLKIKVPDELIKKYINSVSE
jgi:hypothetical protein